MIFNRKAFTGRSGTFYGYEGLGSIYWHMVSKLLLAVQESCLQAISNGEDEIMIGQLLEHFYEINEGIGVHKSPELYGAFPTDPYSHTPGGKGAQQPGMTGQVKEDVISRFGELGVFVKHGKLYFNPCLLRKEEFVSKETRFEYLSLLRGNQSIIIPANSLAFTYCQVPIMYHIADKDHLEITFKDGTSSKVEKLVMDQKTSEKIFKRTGDIIRIKAFINNSHLK